MVSEGERERERLRVSEGERELDGSRPKQVSLMHWTKLKEVKTRQAKEALLNWALLYYTCVTSATHLSFVVPVVSCSSSSAFDMMVALTRFFLPRVPHIWMSGANPLQTPRAWF